MENARAVGMEKGGKILVDNHYTGRQLQVTNESIRHGLSGDIYRLLTNARIGAVAGELIQNAIPINALKQSAINASGTYAMAVYARGADGREVVAIITVEEYGDNVTKMEVYDLTHAISGREKRGKQVDTFKSSGNYPSMVASEISISDLLEAVKSTYQSILSVDVLSHLGETRNARGYYADRVLFSAEEQEAEYSRTDNTIIVRADSNVALPDELAVHEEYHVLAEKNKELVQQTKEAISEEYGAEELEKIVDRYIQAYRGVYGTNDIDTFTEEVLADAYAGLNRFKGFEVGKYADITREVAENGRSASGVQRQTSQASRRSGTGDADAAGEANKAASAESLREAQELEAMGADAESIRKATGWAKTKDGKWNHGGQENQAEAKKSPTEEGEVKLSIANTRKMTWKEQMNRYFGKQRTLRSSDSLYLGESEGWIDAKRAPSSPRYIPTGVVTKAMRKQKGSKSAHELSEKDIRGLEYDIENAPVVVLNPDRNAIIYITENLIAGKGRIVATFDLNNELHGENAHKATSIHRRENPGQMIRNLGKEAVVYVKDKNKLNELLSGIGIQSSKLLAKVEFIGDIVQQRNEDVNTKFSAAEDAEYESAIESGDMEAAQRMVDEAALSWGAIEEDGSPVRVYHGTDQDFNSFDITKGRANMDIQGMFFSPYEIDAKGYGQNVRAFYLKLQNPADEGTAFKALNLFKGQNNAGVKARDYLIRQGYDGVYNGYDEYIAFYPEQAKSADPVTYDDDGNVIPISERFNEEKTDIRYSIEEEGEDFAQLAQELREKNKAKLNNWEDTRDRIYDRDFPDEKAKKTAGELLREFGKGKLRLADLKESVKTFYEDMLKGRITDYKGIQRQISKMAKDIMDNAVAASDYYDENLAQVWKYLRSQDIHVSEELKRNFPDWNDLRKHYFGKLHLVSKGGLDVDEIYGEMESNWPWIFDERRESNPADQLQRIFEVFDRMERERGNPYDRMTPKQREHARDYLEQTILEKFFGHAESVALTPPERAEKNGEYFELSDVQREFGRQEWKDII